MHIHPQYNSMSVHSPDQRASASYRLVTYLYVNVSDASVIFTAAKQQATPGRVSTVVLIYTIHDNK